MFITNFIISENAYEDNRHTDDHDMSISAEGTRLGVIIIANSHQYLFLCPVILPTLIQFNFL